MDKSRLTIAFLNLGHFLDHLAMLIYATAVLVMAAQFGLSYQAMLPLSLGGFIAFGGGSLPAGWLGDRWGRRNMMIVFFLGLGAALVLTGFADTRWQIVGGLTLIGIFASIYHPVGIAMLVRDQARLGRMLGWNGVWGNLGPRLRRFHRRLVRRSPELARRLLRARRLHHRRRHRLCPAGAAHGGHRGAAAPHRPAPCAGRAGTPRLRGARGGDGVQRRDLRRGHQRAAEDLRRAADGAGAHHHRHRHADLGGLYHRRHGAARRRPAHRPAARCAACSWRWRCCRRRCWRWREC